MYSKEKNNIDKSCNRTKTIRGVMPDTLPSPPALYAQMHPKEGGG